MPELPGTIVSGTPRASMTWRRCVADAGSSPTACLAVDQPGPLERTLQGLPGRPVVHRPPAPSRPHVARGVRPTLDDPRGVPVPKPSGNVSEIATRLGRPPFGCFTLRRAAPVAPSSCPTERSTVSRRAARSTSGQRSPITSPSAAQPPLPPGSSSRRAGRRVPLQKPPTHPAVYPPCTHPSRRSPPRAWGRRSSSVGPARKPTPSTAPARRGRQAATGSSDAPPPYAMRRSCGWSRHRQLHHRRPPRGSIR